ncbi:MAG: bifunctional response regulator/alkaline phosphatase family protein [Candidatus Marinimicrobia bacterium]|nr:bifunctional response regulator/alkaline phosphatase family protein [Candidatus Neomarinimicrobiota bacterium]
MKTDKNKFIILWVDDEIELLRSHIMFLKEKGYQIKTATNGVDALEIIKDTYISAVLLDEMMDGLNGLEVLKQIKELRPALPVIMITKNEEESLMENAIGQKISDYLTKPINPSQILLTLKKNLESRDITRVTQAQNYMQYFSKLNQEINMGIPSLEEWVNIHQKMIQWSMEFENNPQYDLQNILNEQKENVNEEFQKVVTDNYRNWINGETDFPLSPDILDTYIKPLVKSKTKTLFIVIDCMRYDQWAFIEPLLYDNFDIELHSHLSILPTATPYSRNAIFAGEYPKKIGELYPNLYADKDNDNGIGINEKEKELLNRYLQKEHLDVKNGVKYIKINNAEFGENIYSNFSDYNNGLVAMVVNFVDMLTHRRSSSQMLKEIIPDEASYRSVIKNWFRHSYIKKLFEKAGELGYIIVVTTDHGSTEVKDGLVVKADKSVSSNVRFKIGRNLNSDKKKTFYVQNPGEYKLPTTHVTDNFLFAKDKYFFMYPNNFRKYEKMFKGTFQHGGISMDEMILPVAILTPKK